MAYAVGNPKTKKKLKEMVSECQAKGEPFVFFQPGPFGKGEEQLRPGHSVTLEGPHYPEPHRWYAKVNHSLSGGLVVV